MRKAKPKKRVILPDPVFNDQKVSKFVNHLMYDGKKNTSYEIFYAALETVKVKLPNEEKSALEIWKKALDNVTPQVEVKSRRVGGATFQVPTEIRPDRKESISMKNLILFARKRGGKSMADKLAAEIMDAFNEQGLRSWLLTCESSMLNPLLFRPLNIVSICHRCLYISSASSALQ